MSRLYRLPASVKPSGLATWPRGRFSERTARSDLQSGPAGFRVDGVALRLRRERQGRGVPLEKAPAVLENLLEGILRFWDESILDTEVGGYRLGHDARGQPTGADSRHVVTQARTAWFFARLARSPYGDDRHLQW